MLMYKGSHHLYGDFAGGNRWMGYRHRGYCFSLTQDMEAVPAGMSGNIIEISFEAALPWVLELPISSG